MSLSVNENEETPKLLEQLDQAILELRRDRVLAPTKEEEARVIVDHLNAVAGDKVTYHVQWYGEFPRFTAVLK